MIDKIIIILHYQNTNNYTPMYLLKKATDNLTNDNSREIIVVVHFSCLVIKVETEIFIQKHTKTKIILGTTIKMFRQKIN